MKLIYKFNVYYKKILEEIDLVLTCWLMTLLNIFGWGPLGSRLRVLILRLLGFKIGKGVRLRHNVKIFSKKDNLIIGAETFVNNNVYFDCPGSIKIGKNCDIGFNVSFVTATHEIISDYEHNRAFKTFDVIVEDFVWIGCNATILPGVKIGKGSVIGAGSVVTKDIPENVLAVGIPAKIIRYFDNQDKNQC